MVRWWRWILVLLAVLGVNLCWIGGRAAAQAPAPNILVINDRLLKEYTLSGTLVKSVPVPDPGGLGDGGNARHVVVDDFGRVHIYDGTFDVALSTLDPATGQWTQRTHPAWSTVGNTAWGGVAAFGQYVFATDMWTAGDPVDAGAGIIRFDFSNNTSTRLFGVSDFRDVTLGLDGLLYALLDDYTVLVINPVTLAPLRTVGLQEDVRALAVDANGDIFGASWSFRIYKFNSMGVVQKGLDTAANSVLDIAIDAAGRIVAGGRTGRVFVTDRQLNTPFVFDSTPDSVSEAFVTFARPTPLPTQLTALASGTTRIDLAWLDNSSTESGFQVERRTGVLPFVNIASLAANTTSYADTGLSADTLYTYRVRVTLPDGNTGYSNEASARTAPLTGGAPTNLTAEGLNAFEIALSWQDHSAVETGFEVERKQGNAPFQWIASLPANTTLYINQGLPPATQYTYRVRAVTPSGETAYSNEATAATKPALRQPPDNLVASAAGSTRIDLRWADHSDTETAFEVERSTGGGAFTPIGVVGSNVIRYEDSGLTPQTTYTYRVRAQFSEGFSAYSNQASTVTFPPGVSPPGNLLAAAVTAAEIQLTWEDRSNNETGFEVERRLGDAEFTRVLTTPPNTTSFADTGLEPEALYTYRVRAATLAGPTGYSNEAAATTPMLQLQAPGALAASAIHFSQINLTWVDNIALEAGFQIERQVGNGAFVSLATVAANTTAYQDQGLQPETTYGYRIRAVRGAVVSPYSNSATATTPAKPLVPPSGLTAGAVSSTEVRLAWRDETDNETGFEIQRKVSGGVYAPLASVSPAAGLGTVVKYTDTAGLQAAQTYLYRVRAMGTLGYSGFSPEVTVTATPLPSAAPASLSASLTGPAAVLLNWKDMSNNEIGFEIQRKPEGGSFTFIGSTPADAESFPDAGLATDTVFVYRIRALGNGGNSAFSEEATVATAVAPPTNVTVTATGPGQLAVSWTDASQTEIGFKVERKSSSGGGFVQVGNYAAGVTGFTDTGLAPATTYTYRVRSRNQSGDSAPSNEASRLTLPAIPTALTVSPVSSTVLRLEWTDGNPSPPAVKVERSTAFGGPFTQVGTSATGTTSFQDSPLAPSTGYYYRVRATNSSGDSGFSEVAFGTTYPAPPGAPSGLTAQAVSGRSVQLAWQDNSSTETGFEVHRRPSQGGGYQLVATTAANATGYLDNTGLSGSSTYFYQVRAVNAGGNSSFSNTAFAATQPDLPAPPTGTAAQAQTHTQVRVTWTDASDNETGFRVERKSEGGAFQPIHTTAAGVTEYLDSGLTESTLYLYRIVAVNGQGESQPSAEVSVTTRPQSPGSLTAAAGNRRIDLTWQDRSTGESGFRIERRSTGGYAALQTTAAGVTSYADTTATAGTTYTYRVFAVSAAGDSAASNESSAVPRNETPLAKLVIAPKAVKFGTVKRGKTKSVKVTLTNKGKEAVMGTVGTVTAPIELVSGGGAFTLAPKGKRTVMLRFTPTAAGAVSAKLRITSTDPKATQVDLAVSATGK